MDWARGFTHEKIAYGGLGGNTDLADGSRSFEDSGVAYTQNQKSFTHKKIPYRVLGAGFGSSASRPLYYILRRLSIGKMHKKIFLFLCKIHNE
jgi:hypothetical protein